MTCGHNNGWVKGCPDCEAEHAAALKAMGSLYEESGGDVTVCEFCEKLLDDSEPWRRGVDGAGAHEECIRSHA